MVEIGEIQGIFKFENKEYVELDVFKKSAFDRTRRIFFAIDLYDEVATLTDEQILETMMIDIIYDANKKSEYLITDIDQISGGLLKGDTQEFVANFPENGGVWLGFFEVKGYKKYTKAGKHTVTIKVAPRNEERDFNVEGAITQTFEFELVEDRDDYI